jgi:hypothetical protein
VGAWGPGLYSDDFALDLKTTVSTMCRLPISGSEIVRLLTELICVTPDDEAYTTFWLVVADQLHRRGIRSEAVDRAVAIIEDGSDLRLLHHLGMAETDLRKREAMLRELREELTAPLPDRERRTLKKPQPFVAHSGEVYTFEVDSRGSSYNPYGTDPAEASFHPVGWGAVMVLRAGRMCEYLAWYQLAPALNPGLSRPTLEEAIETIDPSHNDVGTLPRSHMKRVGLQLLGRIEPPVVDPPDEQRVLDVVASDISAANIWQRYWEPGTLG